MPINQEFLQSDTNNHVIYDAEFSGEAIKHKIPWVSIGLATSHNPWDEEIPMPETRPIQKSYISKDLF